MDIWWWKISGWWRNSRPRPIKSLKWISQRINRGYSDKDWWDFDQYLAGIIASACKKFRQNGMGYPSELTNEEWNEILAKIEWGFLQYTTILDSTSTIEEEEKIIEEMKQSGELLIKWLPGMWD